MAGSGRSNPTRSRTKSSSSEPGGDTTPAARQRLDKRRGHPHRPIKIFQADVKIMVGISLLAAAVILVTVYNLVSDLAEQSPPLRVVTPFPSPKLMDLPQFEGEHKESLYWGTYRPHVYLGIRARTPRSLLAGLMWIGITDGMYSVRHVCQDSDDLSTYGWVQHNGRDFGHQVLVDQDLRLTTSFLKSNGEGSGYGGDWAVRIDVQSAKLGQNEEIQRTGHLFFYLADEDMDHSLKIRRPDIRESSLLASGVRPDVGGWQLHLKSEDPLELHYAGFKTPNIHNLSDLVQLNIASQVRKFRRLELSDTSEDLPNILVLQISGKIPFSLDLSFLSGARAEAEAESLSVDERLRSLTGSSLSSKLHEKKKKFDDKFSKCFNTADKNFPSGHVQYERKFDDKFSQCFNTADKLDFESVEVGKAAISNMLGGIGYFYGESKISYPNISNEKPHDNFISYWPAELYTAVPSRPFFPRGFLWDEGFHQLLIWRWDVRISLDIIGHWLDLMNIDGWIPREQILGSEALSKVPEEFVAQYPSNANPPTLFLVIHDLLDGIKGGKFTTTEIGDITTFLERAFVRLEAWFRWFNTSQSGKETSSYFWHGRDSTTKRELNPKTLSSGLDDYPRASHPNDDERHLDLRSWMLLAAECMQAISHLVNKEEVKPAEDYRATAALLSDFDLLNKMHFDPAYGAYFDYGNHTEKVRLIWKESVVGNGYATREFVREVFGKPELKLVPHFGYVSLFPFTRKVIPSDSWILEKQLDLISNRSLLWTDYGLRSLAKTSSVYMKRNTEHDPPYWRGPVWINMNYLILSSLYHYSKVPGPHRGRAGELYNDLRNNLIRNIVLNYKQNGFLWEQYDQKKGRGKGARLFTGWTALVLLIMDEHYS